MLKQDKCEPRKNRKVHRKNMTHITQLTMVSAKSDYLTTHWICVVVGVEHIISWSGGKDSTATIILAKEMELPIDYILFSEVMFDENISCELPEHIEFIRNVAIPQFNKWGFKTEILHHDKTYMDYFNHVRNRGKNVGKRIGFPMADKCNVRNCKVKPIEKFLKTHHDCIQYVGYCADEPTRLLRLDKNKISLLANLGYTGTMAKQKCEEYNLLSPYYQYSKRGGCWCCPNASDEQLRFVREHHPTLWKRLLELEHEDDLIGNIFNTLANRSINALDEKFYWESLQMTIFDFVSC